MCCCMFLWWMVLPMKVIFMSAAWPLFGIYLWYFGKNENNLLQNQHHNGTHQVHFNNCWTCTSLQYAWVRKLMVRTYLPFIKWLKRPLNVRVVEMVLTLIEATFIVTMAIEGDEQNTKHQMESKRMGRCGCLGIFQTFVTEKGILSQDELDEIVSPITKRVEDAIHFAQESPIPKEEALRRRICRLIEEDLHNY